MPPPALNPTSLGFTGEFTDASGLTFLRARYANTRTGTFLTRDPFEGVMDRMMSRNGQALWRES
jgi:RHS repeat-associated protein